MKYICGGELNLFLFFLILILASIVSTGILSPKYFLPHPASHFIPTRNFIRGVDFPPGDKLCSAFAALSPIVLFWLRLFRQFLPICAQYLQHSDCLSVFCHCCGRRRGVKSICPVFAEKSSHHFHQAQFLPSRPVCLRQCVQRRTSDVSLTWTLTGSSGTDSSRLIAFSSVKICPAAALPCVHFGKYVCVLCVCAFVS